MKREEIRSLSAEELRTRANELREEQFRLRFRSATETLEDPLRLRAVRREIARVLTLLREQELGIVPAATKSAATKSAAKKTGAKKTGARKTASKKGTSTDATDSATAKTASKRAAKRTTKTAR